MSSLVLVFKFPQAHEGARLLSKFAMDSFGVFNYDVMNIQSYMDKLNKMSVTNKYRKQTSSEDDTLLISSCVIW